MRRNKAMGRGTVEQTPSRANGWHYYVRDSGGSRHILRSADVRGHPDEGDEGELIYESTEVYGLIRFRPDATHEEPTDE